MSIPLFRRIGLNTHSGRVAAQAVVLTAVVGGGVAYAQANKDVTLTVDGRTAEVSAFAGTVGELLKDQGISVSQRDIVAPGAADKLHDGDAVVVRYARQLKVVVDGRDRTYWTTELTVDRALAALGIRAEGARLSASRSSPIGRSGIAVNLITPKTVLIKTAESKRKVTTTATSVGALFSEVGLRVSERDQVSTDLDSVIADGMTLVVKRVTTRHKVVRQSIDHAVTTKKSSSMYRGEREVVKQGRDGKRRVLYEVVLIDGREAHRKRLLVRVLSTPVTEIVKVGTKKRPVAASSSSSSSGGGGSVGGSVDSLNWAALAACESGGNPSIVSPNGLYHGLYQFSVPTWQSVGGSGLPSQASSSEQTYRAKLLYQSAGRGSWPVCGSRL